ncbi:MAG: glycosyltransferase family 4 protein [Xanthobacteraceae bacterium]
MGGLKVLMSAYACEPSKGSESGVGWSTATEMARHHEVWAVTRTNNRPTIEAELARNPQPGIHFIYWDLPRWAIFWKRRRRGAHLHYYIWQLRILGIIRALHAEVKFDLIHHVTFVRYWAPCFLSVLGVPLVWGPVGGGESAPRSFWRGAGLRSILYEGRREVARWVGERGPFVRMTARRSAVALATTEETAVRLRTLGARHVETFSQIGLSDAEFLGLQVTRGEPRESIRFLSVGELAHWKGFDISLRAFARANLDGAEYWLIGDGRDRRSLEEMAAILGIADRVRFLGRMSRHQVFHYLQACDVLLHPVLRDSGGMASIEAMAAGLPVICLDLGGPAAQVTANSGFKIAARDPVQASRDIANAMIELAGDQELRFRLGGGARQRVKQEFCWSEKGRRLNAIYQRVAKKGGNPRQGRPPIAAETRSDRAGSEPDEPPSPPVQYLAVRRP